MATGMPEPHQPFLQPTLLPRPAQPCEGFACPAADDVPRWLCIPCSSIYCDVCWERQGPHKPGKLALDRIHEKIDKDVYDRLKEVFDPQPHDVSPIERASTLWLGAKDASRLDQCCHESVRYDELLAETSEVDVAECFPLLVSFLGQTGSGVTTIIKMLLTLSRADDLQKSPRLVSYGSGTSSGVHLYAHPERSVRYPVLYAACKDFTSTSIVTEPPAPKLYRKPGGFFANRAPQISSQWAINNVYSRLLYTISDVVVLVVRDTRDSSMTTLTWLVELATKSLDSSSNQELLPRAIIVLNTCDSPPSTGKWEDIEASTADFFARLDASLTEAPLVDHIARLTSQSQHISTTVDLLKYYYSDILVIKIPRKEQVMSLYKQTRTLERQISMASHAAQEHHIRMQEQLNAKEVHALVQEALDHFVSRPGIPFIRTPLSYLREPISPDLTYHIATLAKSVAGRLVGGTLVSGFEVLSVITSFVASCIYTHCVLHDRPGSPASIFNKIFGPQCIKAANSLLADTICQYQYTEPYKNQRCALKRIDHSMDHRSKDNILQPGTFVAPHGFDTSIWLHKLRESLVACEARLLTQKGAQLPSASADRGNDKLETAYLCHRQEVGKFFYGFIVSPRSRFSCFGCLMETTQHKLSCGHFMCNTCVEWFGTPVEQGVFYLETCPFEGSSPRYFTPCSIRTGRNRKQAGLGKSGVQLSSGGGPGGS